MSKPLEWNRSQGVADCREYLRIHMAQHFVRARCGVREGDSELHRKFLCRFAFLYSYSMNLPLVSF